MISSLEWLILKFFNHFILNSSLQKILNFRHQYYTIELHVSKNRLLKILPKQRNLIWNNGEGDKTERKSTSIGEQLSRFNCSLDVRLCRGLKKKEEYELFHNIRSFSSRKDQDFGKL